MLAIKFFTSLAFLQFAHVLLIVAIDPAMEHRAKLIVAAVVVIDAVVVVALLT